jgi:hypothetical protein
MRQFREVRVSNGSAYIRYADESVPFARQHDLMPDGPVSVDYGPEQEVIGIEIVFVSHADHVVVARDFARASGLAFPRDIAGVLAA